MKKEKSIEFDLKKTMTKKQWLEKQKAKRNANGFNTGERMFENKKKPKRAKNKENFQKLLDKYLYE